MHSTVSCAVGSLMAVFRNSCSLLSNCIYLKQEGGSGAHKYPLVMGRRMHRTYGRNVAAMTEEGETMPI